MLVHNGAARNKKLVDAIKVAKAEVVECPSVKSWELPQFVSREVRRLGGSADSEAPALLVEAVGHDLRALAAAVSQLLADSETASITASQVRRYFGGRAEVTSFAVADATLAGRTGVAMEQLRWALSTGVAPVLVTSAFASGVRGLGRLIGAPAGLREGDLAREVGVPPWKLKSMRSQARGWDQRGLANALQAVAVADAQVKGAAGDAEFALEQLVLAVASQPRGTSQRRTSETPVASGRAAERPVLSGPRSVQTRFSVCARRREVGANRRAAEQRVTTTQRLHRQRTASRSPRGDRDAIRTRAAGRAAGSRGCEGRVSPARQPERRWPTCGSPPGSCG